MHQPHLPKLTLLLTTALLVSSCALPSKDTAVDTVQGIYQNRLTASLSSTVDTLSIPDTDKAVLLLAINDLALLATIAPDSDLQESLIQRTKLSVADMQGLYTRYRVPLSTVERLTYDTVSIAIDKQVVALSAGVELNTAASKLSTLVGVLLKGISHGTQN